MTANPRIAITGATGVLGRSARQWWPDAEWIPFTGDVRDLDALRRWIADAGHLDALLHFAAIVPVGEVERAPHAAFEVNVRGTWNLLEAARGIDPWIFIASSSHVYADSLYGVTKLQAEQAALAYARLTAARVCIGRIFSFSAPSQGDSYLLPSLMNRIRSAEKGGRVIVRNGSSERDFLTTRQVIAAIRTLYEHRETGVVDIGSGVGITIVELAQRLARRMGREDLEISADDGKPTSLIADIARIRRLGFNPGDSVDALLEELVEGMPA
jgi:nucleoside-diphosphate-sugar epimerase